MEYVVHTHRGVTEWIGGLYVNGKIFFGLQIPDFDSILVGGSPRTKVIGWDSVPARLRPPVPWLIHSAFDLMVVLGFAVLASGPAAIIAMECGWIVTEVGRQPWVVYGYMTTTQAATTAGGVPGSLGGILAMYAVLGAASYGIIRAMARRWQRTELGEQDVPYGPSAAGHDRAEDQSAGRPVSS
jgi:cytochrome d ubiquinol oxidase subunit I